MLIVLMAFKEVVCWPPLQWVLELGGCLIQIPQLLTVMIMILNTLPADSTVDFERPLSSFGLHFAVLSDNYILHTQSQYVNMISDTIRQDMPSHRTLQTVG